MGKIKTTSQRLLWDVMADLNEQDCNGDTSKIRISNNVTQVNQSKKGTLITMGADDKAIMQLAKNTHMCFLVLIDRDEYAKTKEKFEVIDG